MTTLDLKKSLGQLYKPSAKAPSIVDVPPLRFLMLDGSGVFGEASPAFTESVSALYTLAYQVKFAAKKQLDLVYPVMPLEGLYWDAEAGPGSKPASPKSSAWRLMILLPAEVPGELAEETRERAVVKKGLARIGDVRVQTFSEGLSVQIMHIGPYSEEPASVKRLLAFAKERGLEVTGSHHEIYLGDPSKAAPEKLKTVLRYGVRRGR